jgi:adenine-specific DNA-methyltransferase
LVWEGKYGPDGHPTPPLRVALPFQTVETVNETAQERQRSLGLFGGGTDGDWRNRLIWGDKKYVLPALLDDVSGSVDLVYIDPPFATGADFSFMTTVPGSNESFTKEPSIIEQKAYRDTWGRGLDGYLDWFWGAVISLHELLKPTGSMYVHLDWHVAPYARAILDEVFGAQSFQTEIVWKRTTAHSDSKTWSHVTDTILFYTKSSTSTWNPPYGEHREDYLDTKYAHIDEDGRRYRLDNLTSPNPRPNMTYEWKGHAPPAFGWRYSRETMAKLDSENRIWYPDDKSKRPQLKRYLDDSKGRIVDNLWEDIPPVNSQAQDRTGYRTQKPDALLERIITTSSNAGDLVLDCFVGSGTTAVVAEKTGRRWIAADLGRFAIHTTRKRLLGIADVRPFVVQNLGKYERQVWQMAEFGKAAAARAAAYRTFILELYSARPVHGYTWLHGLKQGRVVHVGTVDAPVTVGDVKQIAMEFRKTVGKGKDSPTSTSVDVLGWDFAFEVNEIARQDAAKAGIDMRFIRIPREVLDKRAVAQGDVAFYELASLGVDVQKTKHQVTLTLTDFVIPVDDVPGDVQRAVSKWTQWIDYWAVDWDNHGDTFHNEWQSYRSRKCPDLDLSTFHEYPSSGPYTIVVKVIDILGNDTTKTLSVTVGNERGRAS